MPYLVANLGQTCDSVSIIVKQSKQGLKHCSACSLIVFSYLKCKIDCFDIARKSL